GSYLLQVDYQEDRAAESEPPATVDVNDTLDTADRGLLDGNDVYVFGDHQSPDDVDIYAITVPAGARIRAEVVEGNRASETCESLDVDSRLTLFNEAGLQIVDDDDAGRGFCSMIDGSGAAPLDPAARNISTSDQIYYLMVRRSNFAVGTQQQFVYRLQVSFR